MEHLFNETIHKTKHYVLYKGVEYLREYDFEELPKLQWTKDPCGEIGESEIIEDYTELERNFNGI